MAVPTGEYRVACAVDLSPLFPPAAGETTVRIERPPPDILDRRLAELRSADVETRSRAAADLQYFTADAGRVVPALVAAARDPETAEAALQSLRSFPEAGRRPQVFLAVLFAGDRYPVGARIHALWVLASYAPRRADVEHALRAAGEHPGGALRETARYALAAYLERTAPARAD